MPEITPLKEDLFTKTIIAFLIDEDMQINSKSGKNNNRSITPIMQYQSTFYGLAKAAGVDEKDSTLPVGQYSEEAKTAIRTMLGIEDIYQDYSSALIALHGEGWK